MAELRAYNPSYRERIGNAIYDMLVGTGLPANRMRNEAQAAMDFVPGLGDVIGVNDAARDYQAGDYVGAGVGGLATVLGMVPMVGDVAGKAVKKAKEPIKKGIKAFHGSPHDFDRFSLDKIGTGEGAQAYGHGLYFAENEGVAKSYRDALSNIDAPIAVWKRPDGSEIDSFDIPGSVALLRGEKMDVSHDELMDAAQKDLARASAVKNSQLRAAQTKKAQEAVNWLQSNKGISLSTHPERGRMYEVNINANPDDFLDWDKPLSEQPQNVRDALGGVLGRSRVEMPDGVVQLPSGRWSPSVNGEPIGRPTGWPDRATAEQALKYMTEDDAPYLYGNAGAILQRQSSNMHPKISDGLREAGIPGIKYLDAGSRGAGDGSRNYVVFDDSLIEIVRKYGIAAAIAGGVITREQAEQMQAQGAI